MDINRLLENFLGQGGTGQSQGAGRAAGQATGQAAGQSGGGLSGLASSLGLGSGGGSGLPSGLAGGAAAGGLIALLMGNKSARKFGGKALTYGGLAVVGGLAYKAWSNYKANTSGNGAPGGIATGAASPAADAFDPATQHDSAGGDMRLTLVRAMISASKADGHIDKDENARLQEAIQSMNLAADEKAFLFDQMNAPSDPVTIARLASGEEQAAEIYLASALSVDIDTPEERRYLERLADALHLPDALRRQLDAQAEEAAAAGQ